MPKNLLKGFARRKSSGNILDLHTDELESAPATSSFRVLERPKPTGYDGADAALQKRLSSGRPLSYAVKGKSAEDLVSSTNRGSGGTNLSGSSGYYDTSSSSARYSSSSTLPSSLDQEHEADTRDELYPRKAPQVYNPQPTVGGAQQESRPSFSARASRAMSFGRKTQQPTGLGHDIAPVPAVPEHSFIRDRAMTGSSYASTAVPPRLEATLSQSDFASDFGNMFEGLEKKDLDDTPLSPPPRAFGGGAARSESPTHFPPQKYERPGNTPSPEPEPRRKPPPAPLGETRRYSWQSQASHNGLMSPSYASDLASPRSADLSEDTVQPPTGFSRFMPGYQHVPLRNQSPTTEFDQSPPVVGHQAVRQTSISSSEGSDDKDHATALSTSPPRQQQQQQQPVPATRTLPSQQRFSQYVQSNAKHPASTMVDREDSMSTVVPHLDRASQNTTPRGKLLHASREGTPFEGSPAGPASRALPPRSPSKTAATSGNTKVMTRAQFEQERATVEVEDDEASEESDDDGYDYEDEAELHAEMTRQRRKQEANLAVYRQQMQKVSGGNPSALPSQANGNGTRPGIDRASYSAPGLVNSMSSMTIGEETGAEDEDDDVPLGILQAHGFPNKNRPPVRLSSSSAPNSPDPRLDVNAGGDAAGGVLPAFARKLPADPYFGAGLVNPTNREPLAFGGAGSVHGGMAPPVQPVQSMYPAGLVGVIAGEERARAARRAGGSPNVPGGGFGQMPLPGNMMPRSNSAMSLGGMMQPQLPGMPPMMTPQDFQNQQMMQMLHMQQQMMQQMMAMQQGPAPQFGMQQSPSQQSLGNGFLNPSNAASRPMSMAGHGQQPGQMNPNTGRAMSMMNPPPQWNENSNTGRSNTMGSGARPFGYAGSVYNYNLAAPAQEYTPSIAPSERSNVGMPSRYRPVSTIDALGGADRTQSMMSDVHAQARHNASTAPLLKSNTSDKSKPTIRVIDKPKGSPRAQKQKVEDEDDEEGWAQMRKKREARKSRTTATTKPHEALGELVTSLQ